MMYRLHLTFPFIILIGFAADPVVILKPNWNKIRIGESITMSCDVEPAASYYKWYHNNSLVSLSKVYAITFAETRHSGDYRCSDSIGGTSEKTTLSVSNGPVILQAPLHVYEGDDVSLRCHSPQGRSARQTTFYRNNQTIQTSATDPDVLPIKYTDLTDTYRCTKPLLATYIYSDDTTISYTASDWTIRVSFQPNWNKLLTGESITMTCHGESHVTYHWFRNNVKVAEGQIYRIRSARVGNSGLYQCQTYLRKSAAFRLDVSDSPLILQAPVIVFLGTDVNLRCHSRPEYSVHRTTFYKSYVILGSLSDRSTYVLPRDSHAPGRYRCERILSRDEYVSYTDEVSLHVRELFSKPDITAIPYSNITAAGTTITLVCNTNLSPLRMKTELQFAFYRDGQEVKNFSLSNEFEVRSAQVEDSGNYSCKVRTSIKSVSKMSEYFFIQVQETSSKNILSTAVIVWIIILLLITIIVIVVVIKYKRIPSQTPRSMRPVIDPREAEQTTNTTADEDICYAKLAIGKKSSFPRATENDLYVTATNLCETMSYFYSMYIQRQFQTVGFSYHNASLCTRLMTILSSPNLFITLLFSLFCFTVLIGWRGSAASPMVMLQPHWNKILRDDYITMSCNAEPAASHYEWYHNNSLISSSKDYTIVSAKTEDNGDYWCSANISGTSEKITLSVTDGPVILQAPLYVYEGDDVSLRCHSPQGRSARQTTFYRNNQIIQTSAIDPDLLPIKYTDLTDTYRCAKQIQSTIYSSADITISYTELSFSEPNITAIPYSNTTTDGNNMTLVCNTNLSPLRMKTELQFAFYRNGQKVRNFSPSNKYEVQSAQLEDSGNYYFCEVRNANNSVKKRSEKLYIQVQETNSKNTSSTTVIVVIIVFILLLLITSIVIVVVIKNKCIPSQPPRSIRPVMDPPEAGPASNTAAYEDVCYAKLAYGKKTPLPRDTENHIVYSEIQARRKRYLMIKNQGSAERPVVTFSPDYNKIFIGEKMTMTCNVESAALRYSWYCDNILVYTGQKYTILSAEIRHNGDYHCQTNAGDRSETVTLNVTDGPVILQAPLYVYEGDDVSLRCHSPQGRSARQTIFYRNNQIIQTSATDPDLLPIKYTDLTDTYRCTKHVLTTITDTHSARTTISYTADAETISVKFVPDWNKLLTGENITMTCYGKGGVNYHWYKDGNKVADRQIYTITSAQVGHRGTYQCRTSNGVSAEFTLEVSDGPVILQAPVFLYRGSDLVLRCHSRPGYSVISTAFFKDDVLQPSLSNSDLITISLNVIQAGRYRCEKKLSQDEYVTYTDDMTLHIKELFSDPDIIVTPDEVTEHNHMNLTCNTTLSPLRNRTNLQFAFYRNGQNVQGFNLSHQYEVQSTHLKDSGNYSCEVKTQTNAVNRTSQSMLVQIKAHKKYESNSTTTIVAILVIAILIIILIIILVVFKNRFTSTNTRQTASLRDHYRERDVYYTEIQFAQKAIPTNCTADEDYVNVASSKTASSSEVRTQVVYSEIKPQSEMGR
ncbi:uncharacterized protein [Pyxicephalus adspersus]|uniref:uncharacterized protein n=1 Tax=Pyxicephalus adspersus TaxID=30357 RepID=UPI003B59BE4F